MSEQIIILDGGAIQNLFVAAGGRVDVQQGISAWAWRNPMVDIRVPSEAFKQSMGLYLYSPILAAKMGENGVRQHV